MSSNIKDRLKNLDTHSSVSKEFRVYTLHGAVLSMITVVGAYFINFTRVVCLKWMIVVLSCDLVSHMPFFYTIAAVPFYYSPHMTHTVHTQPLPIWWEPSLSTISKCNSPKQYM